MVDIQLIWNWFLGIGSTLGIVLTILKIWEIAFSKPNFFLANNELRIYHTEGKELKVKYDFYVINTGRKGLLKIYFKIKPEQNSNTIGLNIPIKGWMSINKHSERSVKGELELNKYISPSEIKFPLELVVDLHTIKKYKFILSRMGITPPQAMSISIYRQGYRFNEDGSGFSVVGRRNII